MTALLAPAPTDPEPTDPAPMRETARPTRDADWTHRVAERFAVSADGGLLLPSGPVDVPTGLSAARRATWTRAALEHQLYQQHYLGRSTPVDETDGQRPSFAREDATLGRRLRGSDGGRGWWQPGWQLEPLDPAVPDGRRVRRGELVLRVRDDELRPDPTGTGVGAVQVRFPTGRPWASPGFYLVTGQAGPASGTSLVRAYCNVTPEAAPQTLHHLIAALDATGTAFTAKVLNHPSSWPRPDAAVVYLQRDRVAWAVTVLRAVTTGLAERLSSATPAFTRVLAPGLALADDPPAGVVPVSFGQHRCRVLARALVAAAGSDLDGRQRAVIAAWREAGLSLTRPHLNPGATDYDLDGAS